MPWLVLQTVFINVTIAFQSENSQNPAMSNVEQQYQCKECPEFGIRHCRVASVASEMTEWMRKE